MNGVGYGVDGEMATLEINPARQLMGGKRASQITPGA